MNSEIFYQTYLFLSKDKIIISVIQNKDSKKIYEEKILIDNASNQVKTEKLYSFLNDHVYKIEKQIKHFVEKINIILKTDEFFSIYLSVKNNNNGNLITPSSLTYSLQEAKDQCLKTLGKNRIIHMLIDKYKIDDKSYFSLPENLKCEFFYLDLRFICISIDLIKNLEEILKRFQISINQVVSANYIESLFKDSDEDLFIKTRSVVEGFNENEVNFHKKTLKNQGFFEKFFNFFS